LIPLKRKYRWHPQVSQATGSEPDLIVFVETMRRRRAPLHQAAEAVMTDNTDPRKISGFNRRKFIAGAAGTAVAPLAAKTSRATANPPAPQTRPCRST